MRPLPLLVFALLTPTPNIEGSWETGNKEVWFDVRQEGSHLQVAVPEMAPEIFAALGGNDEIPGSVIGLDSNRFEAEAHLERTDLPVWQGHDSCDVFYHLEFEGRVHKDHLQIDSCTFRTKISCHKTKRESDTTKTCNGTWHPAGSVDSCKAP